MNFNIRKTDWYKRRVPTKEIQPVSVEVTGFELVANHKCVMIAEYDDGNTYTLTGWVNVNHIGKWTVTGYDPHGKMVLCDIENING